MKAILKIAILGAAACALARMFMKKSGARAAWAPGNRSSIDDIPVVQPLRDASPNVEEPLQDADLRVAQNAPF